MDKAPGSHNGAPTRVNPELEYKVQVEKVKTLQILSCIWLQKAIIHLEKRLNR